MTVIVTDVAERQRYEARVGDDIAAFADYIRTDELVVFTHTEVAAEFEGKGLASTLVRHALDDLRGQNRSVLPLCPFVKSYIERHAQEYADLIRRGTLAAGSGSRRSNSDGDPAAEI